MARVKEISFLIFPFFLGAFSFEVDQSRPVVQYAPPKPRGSFHFLESFEAGWKSRWKVTKNKKFKG